MSATTTDGLERANQRIERRLGRGGSEPWNFTHDYDNRIISDLWARLGLTHPGPDTFDDDGQIGRTTVRAARYILIDGAGIALASSDHWADLLPAWDRAQNGETGWRVRGYPSGPEEWAEAVAAGLATENPWDQIPHGQ